MYHSDGLVTTVVALGRKLASIQLVIKYEIGINLFNKFRLSLDQSIVLSLKILDQS